MKNVNKAWITIYTVSIMTVPAPDKDLIMIATTTAVTAMATTMAMPAVAQITLPVAFIASIIATNNIEPSCVIS